VTIVGSKESLRDSSRVSIGGIQSDGQGLSIPLAYLYFMESLPEIGRHFLQAMAAGSVEEGGYQDRRVVDLRTAPDRPLYLVGDIHARHQVISLILEHAKLEALLEKEEAFLVFLGDLHHREDYEGAGEMETSVETFRRLMQLKTAYPRSVYCLLGNHEFTRTGGTKRGYHQGDLFREALQRAGLWETYEAWLKMSPLAVIHSRCVGVHAGPPLELDSLEDFKTAEIRDVPPLEMDKPVWQSTFTRHVDWSPNPAKHYYDHHVTDFLELCGVAGTRLITGHTPLDRETDWMWDIGKHLTVIFAAARDIGYFRVDADAERFVRVGRFTEGEFRPAGEAEHAEPGLVPITERGRPRVRVENEGYGTPLRRDVEYLFEYPDGEVELRDREEKLLSIAHYRHLPAWLQSYYAMGYYLIGNSQRQEIMHFKSDLAMLLGGDGLREGVRFSWNDQEFGIITWLGDGRFVFRPLMDGLSLCTG